MLDLKLTFEEHYKTVLSKTNRTKGLMRKLQNLLPREALITICKAFVRSYLDFGDVLFGQAFYASSHEMYACIRDRSRITFRVLRNVRKKSITIRCIKSKGFYCRLF